MGQRGQHGRRQAEHRDTFGRHIAQPPRQDRIARPGQRTKEGQTQPKGRTLAPLAPKNDDRRPRKGDQRAYNMRSAQPLPGQQARQEDDEQRPQIGNQASFGAGRQAEGCEIQKVIAEKTSRTKGIDLPADCPKDSKAAPGRPDQADHPTDAKAKRVQEQRRHWGRSDGEKRQ